MERPTTPTTNAVDLSGSDGFIQNSLTRNPKVFKGMIEYAKEALPANSSSSGRPIRNSQALELPGPEYFCIMQRWGPFSTRVHLEMDMFVRRLVALQVQLLSTVVAHGKKPVANMQ